MCGRAYTTTTMKNIFPLVLVFSIILFSACQRIPEESDTPSPSSSPSILSPEPSASALPSPISEITLKEPQWNAIVSSPFEIVGSAPGTWFFEGQIIGEIKNQNGESLAIFPLQATGEWMTEEPVEFKGAAKFLMSKAGNNITLIIKNDNPSGLPENDKLASFPLKVAQ